MVWYSSSSSSSNQILRIPLSHHYYHHIGTKNIHSRRLVLLLSLLPFSSTSRRSFPNSSIFANRHAKNKTGDPHRETMRLWVIEAESGTTVTEQNKVSGGANMHACHNYSL